MARKSIIFTLWILLSTVYADNSSQEKDQTSSESGTDYSEQKDTGSMFDRLIEIICESAVNNPDYGKDIGDR